LINYESVNTLRIYGYSLRDDVGVLHQAAHQPLAIFLRMPVLITKVINYVYLSSIGTFSSSIYILQNEVENMGSINHEQESPSVLRRGVCQFHAIGYKLARFRSSFTISRFYFLKQLW
jgi:hypothetical protein